MKSLEGFLSVNQSQKQLSRDDFYKVALLGPVQHELLIKAPVTRSYRVGRSCTKYPDFSVPFNIFQGEQK